MSFVSCIDDDIQTSIGENEIPEIFTDGYALNFTVTLDNMGGVQAIAASNDKAAELQRLENYIDPEKFRVLFFDRQDRFLFESKSRWVKKVVPNKDDNDFSEWMVSVPIYPYGNDEEEGWNWEQIRRVLTGEDIDDKYENGEDIYYNKAEYETITNDNGEKIKKTLPAFKIAILANRPKKEWNMGIFGRQKTGSSSVDIDTDVLTKGGYSIENGPDWKTTETRWGSANAKFLQADTNKIIKVYDLHHCQYDPVYEGKNWESYGKENPETSDYIKLNPKFQYWYRYLDFYDFISGKTTEAIDGRVRATMGATSTWIYWGTNDKDNRTSAGNKSDIRKFAHLGEEHPIPMYGIQAFAPIKNWVKGTPFNLSKITDGQETEDYTFKSISLLRSVVKLELVLPKKADFVLLYYPNIYARCEPMNVWTPTDEIWDGTRYAHEKDDKGNGETCEWFDILAYGPISQLAGYNTAEDSKPEYQRRMAWFYGAWYEKGFWDFHGDQNLIEQLEEYKKNPKNKFPQIFNSCVQRNTYDICDDFYLDGDGYYHYVVYTGERNINDPSDLSNLDEKGSGKGTFSYWMVQIGQSRYGITLADFTSFETITNSTNSPGCSTGFYYISGIAPSENLNHRMGNEGAYEQLVQSNHAQNMPWPLLRNHVYKITLRNNNYTPSRSVGAEGLTIQTEELYSKSLTPSKYRQQKK